MIPNYSVIIPTINEEHYLEKCLSFLSTYDVEIIVSDGGSTDNTLDVAKNYDTKIVSSKKGRGTQLNEGANAAEGEIFCFLHADTLPPKNFIDLLNKHFEVEENQVARFKLRFDVSSKLLKFYSHFTKYESLFTSFGDMFICVRKNYFLTNNSFPDWYFMEDVEFFRKVRKNEKIAVLNEFVASSARNFFRYGVIKQQINSLYYLMKYILGFRKYIEFNSYSKRKFKSNINSTITFTKFPEAGRVKTRLAATIGNKKALDIYKTISQNIFYEIKKLRSSKNYIFYSGSECDITNWIRGKYYFAKQVGDDLGLKMLNAFNLVFNHGSSKAIIVGTDVPNLSSKIIEDAFTQLDDVDIVIGPSPDGGYYLLGMKKRNHFLFQNMKFSTEDVLSESITRIEENKLTHKLLPILSDIDTEQDLTNWLSNNKDSKLFDRIKRIYT